MILGRAPVGKDSISKRGLHSVSRHIESNCAGTKPTTTTRLPTRNRADDEKRLPARGDGFRQRGVRRVVRPILLADVEAKEWAALFRDVIADGSLEHREARLERVEDGTNRDRSRYVELDLSIQLRESAQVQWQGDANHFSV